jgi:hypothetical protein
MVSLHLSYNKISELDALRKLTKLSSLSVSNNQLKYCHSLSNLTNLELLALSNNRLVDISPLKGLTKLKNLSLSQNRIEDFRLVSKFHFLEKLSISFNSIESTQEISFDALTDLRKVFLDKKQTHFFEKRRNNKIVERKAKNKFYKFLHALFLVTEDDLSFLDCTLTLDFMKRNIHFNLFYYEQVDWFFERCHHMDLDMDYLLN